MRRLLVLSAATAVLLPTAAPAALAASSDSIVHRESVLTELDPTGAPGSSRVFTQMTVPAGQEVSLPGQSTASLRGLSGTSSRDGDNVVFGSGLSRTVADHTATLPVEVEVSYSIDGQTVDAADVVGHDGEVAVTYVVRNLTAVPTEVSVSDGDRVASRETVDVAVPLVGSLSMTLPAAFSEVEAPGAVVVGDGRGNTVVNWSLLLFAPLGDETQEVTWTADARDAVVPEALLQVVPVSPESFGSFGSTEAAYEGAVGSTRELTAGARQIDRNLKLLADGAGKLLAGLTQLRDGSAQLSDGLAQARDGSGELSAGLGKARDGAGQLSDGLGELSGGAGQLSDGATAARDGAGQLSDGLGKLSDGASRVATGLAALDAGGRALSTGLGKLSAGGGELATGVRQLSDGAGQLDQGAQTLASGATQVAGGAGQLQHGIEQLSAKLQGEEGLPAALAGINQLQAGVGDDATAGTLLYGLALVGAGLDRAKVGIGDPATAGTLRNGVARIGGGVSNPSCNPANPANPDNPCGISQLNSTISTLSGLIVDDLTAVITELTLRGDPTLGAAITTLHTDAYYAGVIGVTAGGIDTIVTKLQGGLALVDGGLAELSASIDDPARSATLIKGVNRITGGVSNPHCNLADPSNAANPCGLLQGLEALEIGLGTAAEEIAAGLGTADTPNTLLWGAAQVAGGTALVSEGAGRLQAEGTSPLAAGAQRAAAGAEQLATGAVTADEGAAKLSDGAGQLADGSAALADGTTRAASGSQELVDGLTRLDEGGAKLAAGAGRAASGSSDLADGLVKLDDGGQRLSDGLGDAADGSQQITDGLGRATAGGEHIATGAQRLTDEGSSVMARSVSDASASSSLQLAHVRAVAARGANGDGLPYPTVEGAMASAVYEFELAGVGADPGPGVAGRLGIGALALLVAAMLGSVAGGRLGRRTPVVPSREGDLVDA